MRWLSLSLAPMLALALGGCHDDAVGGGADGSGTSEASGSTGDPPEPSSSDEGPATDDAPAPVCTVDSDCNDDDPCTVDVCDAGTCTTDGTVLSNECRPAIDVEFPPRGATLRSNSPTVTVTGRVSSDAAAIAWLRINGEDV